MAKVVRLRWILLCITSVFILAPSPALSSTIAFDEPSLPADVVSTGNGELFPEPAELKPNVDFWTDVYTKYTDSEAIIHDNVDLDIRYEVIDITTEYPRATRRYAAKQISLRKKHYAAVLMDLYQQDGECYTDEQCRVAQLFGNTRVGWRYRDAAENIRTQWGLSNRFVKGLVASGQYMEEMKRIFAAHGLPLDLLALPHVESSFNVKAYSHVGAAGIWQFMRSTGRRFMKINNTVDERRDPLLATEAAARFLRGNYNEIGSWPLTVTSYNHGRNGMLNAQRQFGNDIGRIVRYYRGSAFGFASRNFYSEFLAARKIMADPERYFGSIDFKSPLRFEMVKADARQMKQLASKHGVEKLAALNPALHRHVWQGRKPMPKGYLLRVPEGVAEEMGAEVLMPEVSLSEVEEAPPENTRQYTVAKGDTLFSIARKFNTTVDDLKDLNGLGRHRIRPRQKLLVPLAATMAATAPKAVQPTFTPAVTKPVAAPAVKPAVVVKADMRPVSTPSAPAVGIPAPSPDNYRLVKAEPGYGVVAVMTDETLGHYAEWSGSTVKDIIRLNRWKRAKRLNQGQALFVPLTKVDKAGFEGNRFKFHQGQFNSFFASYRIDKVDTHVVRKGQSIWTIGARMEDLPFWLLSIYNQGKRLDRLRPGETIRIPVVERKES